MVYNAAFKNVAVWCCHKTVKFFVHFAKYMYEKKKYICVFPHLTILFPCWNLYSSILLALCFFFLGLGSFWILLGEFLIFYPLFYGAETVPFLLLTNHSSHFVWCALFMNSLYLIPIPHPICLLFPPPPLLIFCPFSLSLAYMTNTSL